MEIKFLQINTTANRGSTGKITEDIANIALLNGFETYIAYGRSKNNSKSKLFHISNKVDAFIHLIISYLLDSHGLASRFTTKKFIKKLEKIKPNIIHLHNLHGYYINYEILFQYLNTLNIPVVWTFHDCWPITGHCSFFDAVNCSKWKIECNSCPNKKGYPKSIWLDHSKKNFHKKKGLFSPCKKLFIVTPSLWLENVIKDSFLKDKNIITINNGIDLDIFRPKETSNVLEKKQIPSGFFIILGVANIWDKRKGLNDFIELSKMIDCKTLIILVGLNKTQIKSLPANIIGISHTENITKLSELYSTADVFVNPTYVDNFPTTNIEALACGTPVITYNTGGSPEAISEDTGLVVEKGDILNLKKSIDQIKERGKAFYSNYCRERAVKLYNKSDRYNDYIDLYSSLLKDCKK